MMMMMMIVKGNKVNSMIYQITKLFIFVTSCKRNTNSTTTKNLCHFFTARKILLMIPVQHLLKGT